MPFVDNADFWEWLALNAGLVGLAAVPAQRAGDALIDRVARWRRPEGAEALTEVLRRHYHVVLSDRDLSTLLGDRSVWFDLAEVIGDPAPSGGREGAHDRLAATIGERLPGVSSADADALVMFLTSLVIADMSFGDAVRGAQVRQGLAGVQSAVADSTNELLQELTGLRQAVDRLAAAAPPFTQADDGRDSGGWHERYLRAMEALLRRAPPWQPGSGLDDLWLERKVNPVLRGRPTGRAREGTVSWRATTDGVRVVAVIAPAGSGKTWALRSHLLNAVAVARSAPGAPVPVWTHAHSLAIAWTAGNDVVALAAGLVNRSARSAGIDTATDLAEEQIRENGMVLAVDGLDEVHEATLRLAASEALAAVGEWIRGRTDNSQLLFASRLAGFENPIREFGHAVDGREVLVELVELAPNEVEDLYDRWCDLRGGPQARARLRHVTAPGSPLRSAVRIPLLAALSAWVAETDDVSPTRAALFDQVIDRFLERRWKSGELQTPLGAQLEDPAWAQQSRAALAHVAGVMAMDPSGWQEQITAARCEALLAAGGAPPPPPGRTRLWAMCFLVGALTPLGLAEAEFSVPIGWMHRSFQRFLAAEHVMTVSGPSELVRRPVDEDWADVVLFASHARAASGLQLDPTALVSALLERCILGDDPFGLVSETLARLLTEAGASLPSDLAREAHTVVLDRLTSGFIDPTLAGTLNSGNGQAIISMLAAGFRGVEIYDGLLASGEQGLALLEQLVTTTASADGAARALAGAAPSRAVTAVLARAQAGLNVASRDLHVLSGAPDELKEELLDRYNAQPEQQQRADLLAAAAPPKALGTFVKHLRREQAQVRIVAIRGLGRLLSFEVPREVATAVRDIAAADTDSDVREAATTLLRAWQVGAPVALQTDEVPQRPLPELHGLELVIGLLQGSREEIGIGLQLCLAKPELGELPLVATELDRLEQAVAAGRIEHDWVDALARLRPAVNGHLLRHVQAAPLQPARHAAIAIPYLHGVTREQQLGALAAGMLAHDDRWIVTSFNVAADQAPELAVAAICHALNATGDADGYACWRLTAAGRRALDRASSDHRPELLRLAEDAIRIANANRSPAAAGALNSRRPQA